MSAEDVSPGHLARRSVGIFVGLAVLSACLTILFLSMRAVMSIGGYCASGGPYVIATPCPDHVPMLMIGSIWIGLGALVLYGVSSYTTGGPRLFLLAWPALFISLGWNFLEFGLDPPGDGGIVWSWIICAVMFFAMGGGPLLFFLSPGAAMRLWWGPPGPDGEPPPRAPSWAREAATTTYQRTDSGGITHSTVVVEVGPDDNVDVDLGGDTPPSGPSPSDGDLPEGLVDQLERLAALHRRGSLSTAEFTAAKQALLGGHQP